MKFCYTAKARFGPNFGKPDAWKKYIDFSALTHLRELVSLDGSLNETIFEPDRGDPGDWDFIVLDNLFETGLFNSLEYVISKIRNHKSFNLLTVVQEPDRDCSKVALEGFSFMGYELLDKSYDTSALTNCGGSPETFHSSDLNEFGLITSFKDVFHIRSKLLENNPTEYHADCNVLAVWRHEVLGQH